MKLVLTGDFHLDAVTAGIERRAEIERAVMDGPVRAAVEGKADLFVFLGDLCDPGRSAVHDAAFPIKVAHALAQAGVASAWLTGNHDVILSGELRTTLDPLAAARVPGCRVYRQSTMDLHGPCGTRVLALPYVAAAEWGWRADLLVGSGPVVALGHCTAFPGAAESSEAVEFARGRGQPWPDLAGAPVAFAANGHLHAAQQVDVAGTGTVHFPGALARLTFGECGNEPGFLVAEVLDGRPR